MITTRRSTIRRVTNQNPNICKPSTHQDRIGYRTSVHLQKKSKPKIRHRIKKEEEEEEDTG